MEKSTPQNAPDPALLDSPLIRRIRDSVIGDDQVVPGPYGPRRVTYADYTASGSLIGHILQGRDMVREAAVKHPIDAEKLLRLEHIIVAHQRLPEWGAPKPPMTPEALLVHYADDMDAKLQMMVEALQQDSGDGLFTTSRNPLKQRLYRGPGEENADSSTAKSANAPK